jgi:transposase
LREFGGKMSGAASCPCCGSKACAKRRLAKMGEKMLRSWFGTLVWWFYSASKWKNGMR